MDEKILSYHDVLLRVGDVLLLRDGNWLNDQVIEFAFEYLLREAYQDVAHKVAFVPGATSFLLSNMGAEDAKLLLGQLKCADKDAVIFAVNDNTDLELAGGGSHWSMLVYWAEENTFLHYDSSSGTGNEAPAARLAKQAGPALHRGAPSAEQTAVGLQEGNMPKQSNGYDCGVYVIGAAELLCRALQQGGGRPAFQQLLGRELTRQSVSALRSKYMAIIEQKSCLQ